MNSILPKMMDNHPQQAQGTQTLLQEQLNRQEFLIYLGTLFLLITGVAGLMKALHNPISSVEAGRQASGFGRGTYGGKRNSNS